MSETAQTCYEQPLNERIRTFLRLEHLFAQTDHHRADTSEWGVRATMCAVLDIFTILSRHDVRTECLKELENLHATLAQLDDHQSVDHSRLDNILQQLNNSTQAIKRIQPQFAAYLIRDNELLKAINNRHAIPGGMCSFDLPSYRFWLSRPAEEREDNIRNWLDEVQPFRNSIRIILQLFRDSVGAEGHIAKGGVLVHNTEPSTQLLRVLVPDHECVFPEISAGRHRSTIRFMEQAGANLQVSQTARDIPFQMTCCRL